MITLAAALTLAACASCLPPPARPPAARAPLPATLPYERPAEPVNNPGVAVNNPPAVLDSREADPSGINWQPARTDLARDILRWTNVERIAAGLQPLAWSDRLSRAARWHSEEMARLGYFSHTSPIEATKTPMRRAERAGVRSDSLMVAENIAMGTFTDSDARAIVKMWMDSSGHRANILRRGVYYLGVGVAYRGRELYATQVFANVP